MDLAPLLADLPPEQRLALAYAPRAARPAFAGLMALDARLARIIRASREPLLAQLRLAWWREQLASPDPAPGGEPLLELLALWGEHRTGLGALVDGWEALLGDAPLEGSRLAAFAAGRGSAAAALARCLGVAETVAAEADRAARNWTLADLAARLSHPEEVQSARHLVAGAAWHHPRLPRSLRPLAVLHALSRATRGQGALLHGPGSIMLALRVGLFGR